MQLINVIKSAIKSRGIGSLRTSEHSELASERGTRSGSWDGAWGQKPKRGAGFSSQQGLALAVTLLLQ